MELAIVVSQALAAWGFSALFQPDRPVAAFGVAAFAESTGVAHAVALDALTIPATIGELWMVGYLLVRGIRPASTDGAVRVLEGAR